MGLNIYWIRLRTSIEWQKRRASEVACDAVVYVFRTIQAATKMMAPRPDTFNFQRFSLCETDLGELYSKCQVCRLEWLLQTPYKLRQQNRHLRPTWTLNDRGIGNVKFNLRFQYFKRFMYVIMLVELGLKSDVGAHAIKPQLNSRHELIHFGCHPHCPDDAFARRYSIVR